LPFTVHEPAAPCDFLPTIDHARHLARFSKNFRHNLKRARARLAERVDAEFVTAASGDDLPGAFQELLDVEASGWKGDQGEGSAVKSSPELAGFYRQVMERFGAKQCCRISLLRLGGRTIAGLFLLLVGDSCYVLKTGYDESFSPLAPGNLILERLLEDYANHPRIRFVNLITASSWHRNWRPEQYPTTRCAYFNKTQRGFTAFVLLKCKQFARPVYKRLRNRSPIS
jgi:CelD/BcsL family acetyltransferase involved in cellulose biosynthesis